MSTMTPCTPTTPARAWLESLRPKTLPLAFASIVMGSAIASLQGVFHPLIALLALLTAGCLQILSNLANDYGDAEKGSDTPDRIGPLRGMQKGLITAAQMKRAIMLTIALTIVCGIALIAVACHKPSDVVGFLILGLLSIGAAITYTVGTRPYGYMGLGDISVLIFFGWISVAGTFYLQAGYFDWIVMLPATATGLLSTAVLNINNLRDIETRQREWQEHAGCTSRPGQRPPLSCNHPDGRCRVSGDILRRASASLDWLVVYSGDSGAGKTRPACDAR